MNFNFNFTSPGRQRRERETRMLVYARAKTSANTSVELSDPLVEALDLSKDGNTSVAFATREDGTVFIMQVPNDSEIAIPVRRLGSPKLAKISRKHVYYGLRQHHPYVHDESKDALFLCSPSDEKLNGKPMFVLAPVEEGEEGSVVERNDSPQTADDTLPFTQEEQPPQAQPETEQNPFQF